MGSVETLTAKKIFDTFYCRTSKHFGQNFLFNENINRKIVATAGDLSGKVVTEVGPGPGGLTLEILKQDIARLYVIEYDRHWAEVWRQLQPLFDDKLIVIECDALQFDIKEISPQVIISNLPYNISTKLLCKWLAESEQYEKFVLMFQKEVADRICASCGTKDYGKLSVISQWQTSVKRKFDLEPGSFTPSPKVKSTVVEFVPYAGKGGKYSESFSAFSNFLNDLFSHKRKMVAKVLRKYFKDPVEVLQNLGYHENVRPGAISVNDYWKMFCTASGVFSVYSNS